tara:strand:- start:91 stop:393 length:303 start_codon:yes stop_codon:yes gene_type:complete
VYRRITNKFPSDFSLLVTAKKKVGYDISLFSGWFFNRTEEKEIKIRSRERKEHRKQRKTLRREDPIGRERTISIRIRADWIVRAVAWFRFSSLGANAIFL